MLFRSNNSNNFGIGLSLAKEIVERDTGWIQIYAENNQEAYDNFIQAYPIAEDTRVHLPVMICQDGFITSHAVENITLLEDEAVKDFVGEYHPEEFLLNPGKPIAVGPYSVSNYAMEAKKNQEVALENVTKAPPPRAGLERHLRRRLCHPGP